MEQKTCYHIRRMKDGDISQVLEIDLDAFPTQWPHPTFNSFRQELRNKLAHYLVIYRNNDAQPVTEQPHPMGVKQVLSYIRHLFDHDRFFGPEPEAIPKEYLIGMVGIWMMVDEAHITTIAVRNSHKHQGMGERLLIAVIDLAMMLHAHTVTLEVRVSNTLAQKLYEKYGFAKAGIRRRYYSDNHEDGLVMTTDLLTSSDFQERFQRLKDEHQKHWSQSYILS